MKIPDLSLPLYDHKYIPEVQDIENYQQLANTCGLASVLMLARLDKHTAQEKFLEKVCETIRPLIEVCNDSTREDLFSEKEFQYQFALQYLLLKSLSKEGYDFLYDFLREKCPHIFEDQKAVHLYKLDQLYNGKKKNTWQKNLHLYEDYLFKNGLIYPGFLLEQIQEYKTDIEIKILMELLG